MVCPGGNCDFGICLECCVSESKIKDAKGHPCKKYQEREAQKIVCDYCAKFKPGIVSCAKCNIDICRVCSNDKTIAKNKITSQPSVVGDWHGVTVDERPNNYVDYKLKFESNGEIIGTAVDPCDGEGARNLEVFGYHYLQNIAMISSSQDERESYIFAGTADHDYDEIYGRWWLISCQSQDQTNIAERIILTKKK